LIVNVFDKFGYEIKEMRYEAVSIQVWDDNTYAKAQEMSGQAKKLRSVIDKKRVELKAPYLEFTKFLDSEAGAPIKDLDTLSRYIESDKMLP
jgi:hypothetical protein